MTSILKKGFITKDKSFYSSIGKLMSLIILQNIIAYSINMADNIMLGSYSQEALSGAATVNQIQFIIQQITIAIGDAVVVLGSQYWGKGETSAIKKLTKYALLFGAVVIPEHTLLCRKLQFHAQGHFRLLQNH